MNQPLEDYSVVRLKTMAASFGIKTSGMRKPALVSAIKRETKKAERKAEKEAKKEVKIVRKPVVSVLRDVDVILPSKVEKRKEEPKLPIYENYQVVKVLESRHNQTHLHCLMSNGSTQHVPRKLFNG